MIYTCKFTDEQIQAAKTSILTNLIKADNIASNMTHYAHSLIHRIHSIDKRTFMSRIKKIKRPAIETILKEFQKDVLKYALIFYCSRRNQNKQIKRHLHQLASLKHCQYLVL